MLYSSDLSASADSASDTGAGSGNSKDVQKRKDENETAANWHSFARCSDSQLGELFSRIKNKALTFDDLDRFFTCWNSSIASYYLPKKAEVTFSIVDEICAQSTSTWEEIESALASLQLLSRGVVPMIFGSQAAAYTSKIAFHHSSILKAAANEALQEGATYKQISKAGYAYNAATIALKQKISSDLAKAHQASFSTIRADLKEIMGTDATLRVKFEIMNNGLQKAWREGRAAPPADTKVYTPQELADRQAKEEQQKETAAQEAAERLQKEDEEKLRFKQAEETRLSEEAKKKNASSHASSDKNNSQGSTATNHPSKFISRNNLLKLTGGCLLAVMLYVGYNRYQKKPAMSQKRA